MILTRLGWLLPAALLLALSGPGLAQDGEDEAPTEVAIKVDVEALTERFEESGRIELVFRFRPLEDVSLRLAVRCRLVFDGRELLARDHVPPRPTQTWKKDEEVEYRLPVLIPIESVRDRAGEVGIEVSFQDSERRGLVQPRGEIGTATRYVAAGRFTLPRLTTMDDPERIEATLARAAELVKAKDRPGAFSVLEAGLRLADTDATKLRFRAALLDLGEFEPRPIGLTESETVRRRIADERRRFLRQVSGRMYDRGRYHGALEILKEIGGSLEEDADLAVIGALDDVQRVEKDRQDLLRRIREQISDAQKAEAEAILEKNGQTAKSLEKARALVKKGELEAARHVLWKLRFADDQEVRDAAYREIDEIETKLVERIPEDQAREVKEALEHEAWSRTVAIATHNFIFIGPRPFLEGIPGDSRLKFDVAYILLTDLFARVPNAGGDRITVYFKELWEFAGGVAGGRTIDIGSVRPKVKGYRVDTGLMYHELTHCIENVQPKFQGFTEGLADVGAVFCQEFLAVKSVPGDLFRGPLDAFKRHYLDRDLEYWRIPEYAPSCGFFLHFMDRYAKAGGGRHDWQPLRRFIRDYANAPVRDGREPQIVRAFAFYLMKAFGEPVFDDLVRFRFPLVESDRKAIALELQHFTSDQIVRFDDDNVPADALQEFPNSILPRDLEFEEMLALHRRGGADEEVRIFAEERLGILHDWKVIGPFRPTGSDPDACVFPPETEIDFEKRYPSGTNVCFWVTPGRTPPAQIFPTGWVRFDYVYQDNTAIYAVNWIEVPEGTEATAHLRGDDDVTLFLDDRLVGKYQGRGWNGSTNLWWRGPVAEVPDAIRFPVTLAAGRHKVLVKIRNRFGPAGFSLAFTRRDNRPIDRLSATTEPPSAAAAAADPEWKSVQRHRFDGKSFRSQIDVAEGTFRVRQKHLEGVGSDGKVTWRPYDVRPGVKKDSPSNLFWLKDKVTKDLEDFRFTLDLAADRRPKLALTFMGEGGSDGLSGWTLILHASGGDAIAARIERYDRLVYQCEPFTPKASEEETVSLTLTLRDGRLDVSYAGETILAGRPIRPIPGRTRIGLATWDPETRIRGFELFRPRR
ncbi:MAG: hypothetical protein R3F20_17050 [Planctomycetota bacterium]